MMRILVFKLTSMGDVIHVLPALTDAYKAIPDLQVDFVVEQPFAEIPAWHASVNKVIPVATRRWRKNLWSSRTEIITQLRQIREQQYDAIIDADALIVVTEWSEFRMPNFRILEKLMVEKTIFDGRNIYDPEEMGESEFTYYSIGRDVVGNVNKETVKA